MAMQRPKLPITPLGPLSNYLFPTSYLCALQVLRALRSCASTGAGHHTMNDYTQVPLINDTSSRQFEMEVEGRMAKVEYELNGTKMFLTHAKVPKALEGLGVGAAIVERVFSYIEENNLKLVPMCAFVTAHLRKHPEWKRIVEKGVQV